MTLLAMPATEERTGELVADRVIPRRRQDEMMGSEMSTEPSCMYRPRRELRCFRLGVDDLDEEAIADRVAVAALRSAAETAAIVTGMPRQVYSLHTTRGLVVLTVILTFNS